MHEFLHYPRAMPLGWLRLPKDATTHWGDVVMPIRGKTLSNICMDDVPQVTDQLLRAIKTEDACNPGGFIITGIAGYAACNVGTFMPDSIDAVYCIFRNTRIAQPSQREYKPSKWALDVAPLP